MTECVAEGKDPFLGARFFLVAPCAPDQRIEAEFLDRVQQRHRLVPVATLVGMSQDNPAVDDRVFYRPHNQPLAKLRDAAVAKIDDFREVVASVDVQQRKRKRGRSKRLLGQSQQNERILSTRKKQGRAAALSGDFAQDVHGLGFEPIEVMQICGDGDIR